MSYYMQSSSASTWHRATCSTHVYYDYPAEAGGGWDTRGLGTWLQGSHPPRKWPGLGSMEHSSPLCCGPCGTSLPSLPLLTASRVRQTQI